jgi:hypothetical protein
MIVPLSFIIGSLNVGAEFLYGWHGVEDGDHNDAPRLQ